MNALLASALSFAASALSASEMSCRLSFDSPGDGGCEVAGVLGWDETALDPESLDITMFVPVCYVLQRTVESVTVTQAVGCQIS